MKKLVLIILSLFLITYFPVFADDLSGLPMDPLAGGDLSGEAVAAPEELALPNVDAAMPADTSGDSGQTITADPLMQEQGILDTSGIEQVPEDGSIVPELPLTTTVEDIGPGPALSVEPTKQAFPQYKAVPYTNDLRIMDEKTGALGQVDTLRRIMDWDVTASSSMETEKHLPNDTKDLNAYTAWVENKEGSGVGESITLHMDSIYFSAIQEGGVNSVICTGLKIINGINTSHDDWFNNARVKLMKIYQNNVPFCLIELYDSTNWQDITFTQPMTIKPNDIIKAEIVDVFEGYKYQNAGITEFLLVGKPAGNIIGAEQMNGKDMTNVRNGGLYFK